MLRFIFNLLVMQCLHICVCIFVFVCVCDIYSCAAAPITDPTKYCTDGIRKGCGGECLLSSASYELYPFFLLLLARCDFLTATITNLQLQRKDKSTLTHTRTKAVTQTLPVTSWLAMTTFPQRPAFLTCKVETHLSMCVYNIFIYKYICVCVYMFFFYFLSVFLMF